MKNIENYNAEKYSDEFYCHISDFYENLNTSASIK